MSEYNIQMNKYNALNAGYDQLYPATKIENVDGLNTALQNKAPAGYGFGDQMDVISADSSSETEDSFGAKIDALAEKMPPNYIAKHIIIMPPWAYGAGYYLATIYKYNFDNIAVIASSLPSVNTYGGYSYGWRFCKEGGVWKPHEWVNPPMLHGKEYRTTERYNGKPVYVQNINFSGALPASGVAQGIINTIPIATTNIIDINVTIKNRTTHEVQRLPSVSTSGTVTAICNPLKYEDYTGYCFRITVFTDMSGWDYQSLIVKYTKSTD